MIVVSSTFDRELRWAIANVGVGLVVALVTTPLESAISLATSWPLEGWNGSATETYLGWTLLLLPFVIVLGVPTLVAVLVLIRLR